MHGTKYPIEDADVYDSKERGCGHAIVQISCMPAAQELRT